MFSRRGGFDGLSALAPASRFFSALPCLVFLRCSLFHFGDGGPSFTPLARGGQLLQCPSLQASCLPQKRSHCGAASCPGTIEGRPRVR